MICQVFADATQSLSEFIGCLLYTADGVGAETLYRLAYLSVGGCELLGALAQEAEQAAFHGFHFTTEFTGFSAEVIGGEIQSLHIFLQL